VGAENLLSIRYVSLRCSRRNSGSISTPSGVDCIMNGPSRIHSVQLPWCVCARPILNLAVTAAGTDYPLMGIITQVILTVSFTGGFISPNVLKS
jgi:hypothetical protein